MIGPTELPAAKQLTLVSGTKRPPVLALADNFSGSPGVYSVRLSEADSAAAGAAAIAAKGSRKFVLFVEEGADSEAIGKRVANSLSIYGASLVVTIPYTTTDRGSEKAVANWPPLSMHRKRSSWPAKQHSVRDRLSAEDRAGRQGRFADRDKSLAERPVNDP